jgi:MFS family permease
MATESKAAKIQVAIILCTGVLVVLGCLGFSRFSMSLIFPYMRQGLSLTYAQIGVIATCNFLGYLMFSFGSGIAASKAGPRRVIAGSLLLSGLAMFLTGWGNGFWWPLICMSLVGVGSAGANIPVMAMAASWVSSRRRGLASGFLIMGSGLGLMINGIAVPQLVTAPGGEGWRSAWIWVGIFSLPSGFIWGWVSDRIGRRWGLFLVYFLHGICLIGFASFPWNTGITIVALVYGSSIFSIPAIMSAACGDEAGPELAPAAIGAVTVAFGLGQMVAPAVTGITLDWGWMLQQNLWLSAIVAFSGALGAALLHTPLSFCSSQLNQTLEVE